MAAITPRRSTRPSHNHTPKMSERKKGLFVTSTEPSRESLTEHRRLPVVDSESDSEECDLGIISTLDSSSGEENDHSTPKTPERKPWRETRSHTRKLIENQDLKSFMKSPFTLKKYQTRYSCPDTKCVSLSTPVTPHLQYHPGTPSSSHSCASAHTTSSTSSRARKSLASLIADTESCSSSLKDLTFDTDSGTDSKENTPTKAVRRSGRRQKMTPKFSSFKGILVEQKKQNSPLKNGVNNSPIKTAVVCLTKMDMNAIVSPSQVKTPQTSQISESIDSPPKIGHSRRSVVEIGESPESISDSEKSLKRLRNNSLTEHGPSSKYPRLDVPKARLSLFNCDRLKEILSAKSFYGKSNPELNTSVTAKISNAIEVSTVHNRKSFGHSHSHRRRRQPGQINMGVKHRIRKPKHQKNKVIVKKYSGNSTANSSLLNNATLNSTLRNASANDASMISQNSSQDLTSDKLDFFDKENQTIEALLSQWEEDDIPESELPTKQQELPCFNSTIIEETNAIFEPVSAVPVTEIDIHRDSQAVIVELGPKNVTIPPKNVAATVSQTMAMPQTIATLSQNLATVSQNVATVSQNLATVSKSLASVSQNVVAVSQNMTSVPLNVHNQDVVMAELETHESNHGEPKSGQFLPVEGGYILVEENNAPAPQEELTDLDEIERELRMLDEQILQMANSNNINAEAVLASTETGLSVTSSEAVSPLPVAEVSKCDNPAKLFPIFSNPNPGQTKTTTTPSSKGEKPSKKSLLKDGSDQYVIDAGQKKFGATQCTECGVIYQIGDPQDEHDHLVHHNATDVLKYNGWKDEHVVESVSTWRIIRVRYGDASWRRVETLLHRVIHPQLGYEGPINVANAHSLTAYLYIEKKQIVGCLIAETKTKAYKLLPGEPDCCSVEDYPVKCGISRVWTHINYRRRGVANRLVDCARASMLYGIALPVCDIAFSAPTAAGKGFATKYCGTENFYVYLD